MHGWDAPRECPDVRQGVGLEEGEERALRSSRIWRRWRSWVGHQKTWEEVSNLKWGLWAEVIKSDKWGLWPEIRKQVILGVREEENCYFVRLAGLDSVSNFNLRKFSIYILSVL